LKNAPLITLEGISVRLRDKLYLQDTSWEIHAGEHWAILGPNGSGKTTLARVLFKAVPVVRGRVVYHFGNQAEPAQEEGIAYVSPELHRLIIQRERLEQSFRDFSGKPDEVTSVKSIILDEVHLERIGLEEAMNRLSRITRALGIEHLMERAIDSLSTGESRKALIARALMTNPRLLILDKPFDGLDRQSKESFRSMVMGLMTENRSLVLITNRAEEVLPSITHVLVMNEGRVCSSGEKRTMMPETSMPETGDRPVEKGSPEIDYASLCLRKELPQDRSPEEISRPEVLIEMKGVMVRYGSVLVLNDFNWTVRENENWAILGPNGAGKTTILRLILGDNPQSYANEITLFGRKKGTGETIWDIKKHIGVVSSDLHAQYYGKTSALEIVCSGFFDSIGLYRSCSLQQKRAAGDWLGLMGAGDLPNKTFDHLSFGQRQLILLARAMVKNPRLLVLDEPCDGLDADNRRKLLDLCEFIGSRTSTRLIYVTHHEKEIPSCVTHVLRLRKGRVAGIPLSFSSIIDTFSI
jgi:molybdate transport system ATP-binding protein